MTDLLQVFKLKHIDSLSLSHQSLSCSFLVMFLLRYEDHLSLSLQFLSRSFLVMFLLRYEDHLSLSLSLQSLKIKPHVVGFTGCTPCEDAMRYSPHALHSTNWMFMPGHSKAVA